MGGLGEGPVGRMTAVNHDKYFTLPVDNQTASVEMSSNVSVITSHDVIISLNYSVSAMVAVSVVLFVVNMVTAFGNLLVCVALVKYKQLRTVSNYLIGNLALSDFLLAVTILPLSTVNECLGYWVFGRVVCNFWLCADVLYCTASIWNLCVIAFDRYTATLYPVWYREKRSTAQAVIYVTIVWMLSLAICIPPLLGWNDLSQNFGVDPGTGFAQCLPFQTASYVIYSASGSFFLPFLITAFLYVRIFCVLRQRMRLMQAVTSCHAQQALDRRRTLQKANRDAGIDDVMSLSAMPSPLMSVKLGAGQGGVTNGARLSVDVGGSVYSVVDDDSSSDECTRTDSFLPSSGNRYAPVKVGGLSKDKVKDKDKSFPQRLSLPGNGVKVPSTGGKVKDAEYIEILVTDENGKDKTDLGKVKDGLKCTMAVPEKAELGERLSLKTCSLSNPLRRKKPSRKRRSQKSRYEQREMRATMRMAVIIAFFCGMWLGFFVIYVVRGLCPDSCPVPRELDALFFWLGYANSTINPVLYTIFNDDFRRAFQKILGCYVKNAQSNVLSVKRLRHK